MDNNTSNNNPATPPQVPADNQIVSTPPPTQIPTVDSPTLAVQPPVVPEPSSDPVTLPSTPSVPVDVPAPTPEPLTPPAPAEVPLPEPPASVQAPVPPSPTLSPVQPEIPTVPAQPVPVVSAPEGTDVKPGMPIIDLTAVAPHSAGSPLRQGSEGQAGATTAPITGTPTEPSNVTPPPPPIKTGSSNNMLVLGIVAAVAILLGGVAAYNAVQQSRSHTAAINYQPSNAVVSQSNMQPTVMPVSDTVTPKNISDVQLQQDEQTVNSQVNQVNTDLDNTDKSLNDQPDNLNQ